jgi:hypothetical protein
MQQVGSISADAQEFPDYVPFVCGPGALSQLANCLCNVRVYGTSSCLHTGIEGMIAGS